MVDLTDTDIVNVIKAERNKALEDAALIADGWLAAFGEQKPQFISAQHWADDAILDIAENIRKLKSNK